MTSGCTDETIYLQNDTAFVDTQEALFNKKTHFLLSPNPADIEVQVKFVTSASTKNKTLKVFAIDGRLVQQKELNGSLQNVSIDLVDFPSGIYILSLEEDGQVLQRERLIKQ